MTEEKNILFSAWSLISYKLSFKTDSFLMIIDKKREKTLKNKLKTDIMETIKITQLKAKTLSTLVKSRQYLINVSEASESLEKGNQWKKSTFNFVNLKLSTYSLLLISIFLLPPFGWTEGYCQNVGINSTGATPNASAILDIDAAPGNNKGLLIPRIPLTDRGDVTTITAAETSLLVYNTAIAGVNPNDVTPGYYYWDGTQWVRLIDQLPQSYRYIPTSQYPTFDAASPFVLNGALWIGYDAINEVWKYNKQGGGRGLSDPGNPNTWTVNGTTIDIWNGDKSDLPSGTHINNRYDPRSMAAKYNQDDIMVRVGSFWVDKYEARIIDVSNGSWQDEDDGALAAPANTNIRGNAQGIPYTWMAFSQKNRGSSGMSWFVAQKAAVNGGKNLISNAEWQAAAIGTARIDATGMAVDGETWATVTDQDLSQFGVVGMVGSLWESVAEWGQFGPDMGIAQGATKDQGAGFGNDLTWHIDAESYTRNTSIGGGGWQTGLPVAVRRGGGGSNGTGAGVFAYSATDAASHWSRFIGFRCVQR